VRVEDAQGAVVWSARLDPFGAAAVSPESTIELSFRMPGHWFDPGTGLHYNRFRYYSPELGRYLQSDPLGLEGGDNLYAYAASPLSHVDLRGLKCPECTKKREAREEADEAEGNPRVADLGDGPRVKKVAERVGMEKRDLENLQKQAKEDGNLIIVRATNDASLDFHGKPGYKPKPEDVKFKTQGEKRGGKNPKHDGLVTKDAQDWSDPKTQKHYDELKAKGYKFGDDGVLRGPPNGKGDKFYGDHDLQGVYNMNDDTGRYNRENSNSAEVKGRVNEAFPKSRKMAQHGANDDFRPGGNMGRHPDTDEHFVIIEPNGTTRVVGPPTRDLQQYYKEKGIKWPYSDYSNCPPNKHPTPKPKG
jgi:RHS repeat-associated protein